MTFQLLKKVVFVSMMLILPFGALQSATLLVPSQYSTIQGAIDACTSGQDVIIVSSGTYQENIDFSGKDVILTSSSGADSTVIQGDSTDAVVTYWNNGTYAKIEGFTITNGSGYYSSSWTAYLGGGIYCEDSSPTIKSNVIEDNTADWGAGICCEGGEPTVTRNTIEDNDTSRSTDKRGAGICFWNAEGEIKNNTIRENTSYDYGGGILVKTATDQQVNIENNTITNNSAVQGGGIYTWSGDGITIFDNSISSNNAEEGAGLFLDWRASGSDMLDSNLIFDNEASDSSSNDGQGGGIYVGHDAIIRNNMIFKNEADYSSQSQLSGEGGGIYIHDSEPVITNNTLTLNKANKGGGIYYNSTSGITVYVTNTIIYNNTAWSSANNEIFHFGLGTLTVTFCDVKGGWVGTGNINQDPIFANPNNNNFKLSPSPTKSPCIGAGSNTAPSIPPNNDFEGEDRITGPIVDMGADEAIGSVPL